MQQEFEFMESGIAFIWNDIYVESHLWNPGRNAAQAMYHKIKLLCEVDIWHMAVKARWKVRRGWKRWRRVEMTSE